MTPTETDLFTRSEVLAGLPARRAQTALFLIESRTARLVARFRQALDPYLSEATAADRDLAFVEAFALGRAPPLRPTIQDLEGYAAAWRDLVPVSPRARAALAQLLGQKYQFTAAAVPEIRTALGLDEPAVAAAYEKLYGQPLATIYAKRPMPAERLRWAWAGLGRRFENLPPFWAVFALTLTETVGVGILALPIALAGIGAIPGVALLGILGLVNVLTIMAQAEAVARSGESRYGHAFLSRMVEDYLGPPGERILWAGTIIWDLTGLLVYFLGVTFTLVAVVTGVPEAIWAAGLLLIALYFLRQESLNATITSALVIGGFNIVLLLLLTLLAFIKLQPEYLLYMNVPLLNGQPIDVVILALIFGTILGAYAGHPSVNISAKFVLPRDPGARSLIWGVAAAEGVAIIFYCIWVLGINGAVEPQVLARETGTALIPLGDVAGPAVRIVGSLYAVLAMTIGTLYCALRLFSLVRERLPRRIEPVVWLPRRQGRLVLQPRTSKATAVISLTYLGLTTSATSPQPRFRVDIQQGETLRRLEIMLTGRYDETVLRSECPHLEPRIQFALMVHAAMPDGVRLQVDTPLAVRYEGEWDATGLHMADLLELPADRRQLFTWLMRRGEATADELAAHTGRDADAARLLLAELVEQGLLVERAAAAADFVTAAAPPRFRPHLAFRRGHSSLPDDLWRALDGETGPDKSGAPVQRPESSVARNNQDALNPTSFLARLGPRGRFWLAASPIVVVFLIAEAFLWTDTASFSGLLSFIGVIVASLLAGVFPALLIFASRRKGAFVPVMVYRVLGRPWLVSGIYILFVASIFLHGLVIWQDPVQRICAVLVGLVIVGATWMMVQQGAFAGRVVVEICQDLTPGLAAAQSAVGNGRFAITQLGEPAAAAVRLVYGASERVLTAASGDLTDFGDLRQIVFDLPAAAARDLKVWAHRVTPDGLSESLPAMAEVRCGDANRIVVLPLTGGQAVLPWAGPAVCVTLHFDTAEGV